MVKKIPGDIAGGNYRVVGGIQIKIARSDVDWETRTGTSSNPLRVIKLRKSVAFVTCSDKN